MLNVLVVVTFQWNFIIAKYVTVSTKKILCIVDLLKLSLRQITRILILALEVWLFEMKKKYFTTAS